MADELVDVVNEQDEIIGKEWKSVCHKEGILHRIAAVFIFNDKGELLLQKRSTKKSIGSGLYDYSASGHIGAGESYKDGARKELNEELGIDTKLKEFSGRIKTENFREEGVNIKHHITLFVGYNNGPFNIQKEELDSVAFFDLGNIEKMILRNPEKFTMGFKLGFKSYMEKK
ncbi:NUDIX domain-containing protein [Candidatus Pacearchaeota archaeon]|nr:NUDIX domain-containing protein [Candidatus Pacearchaeota archaeon]